MDKPTIENVASLIAKPSPPPKWLVTSLEHFTDFISLEPPRLAAAGPAVEMIKAVETLQRWLPLFNNLPLGIQPPADVTKTLEALPGVLHALRPGPEAWMPRRGQPRNVRKTICAAVVVEARRLVHADVALRSDSLALACNAYWLACGCEATLNDPVEHWRSYIERAEDNNWLICPIMAGYRGLVV